MNAWINLFYGLAITLLLLWFFWPDRGLWARWKRRRHDTLRVLMEDALKVLYDCEYALLPCDISQLAGRLEISRDRVIQVLEILRDRALVDLEGDRIVLTKLGRKYALRVIRIHRIWESYLASETGMSEVEWHAQADLREHELSLAEADALAVKLGNPVFDPHGDPIPSREGALPGKKGLPLRDLPEGQKAIILHLEDEPEAVYAQLIAMGLYPGMVVRMLEKKERSLSFEAEGEDLVLAPLLSANVTVLPIEQDAKGEEKHHLTLREVPLGKEVLVSGISKACRGRQRRRLMDLGIVRGNRIRPLYKAPSGDPVAYDVLGANIALREEQAKFIFVEFISDENPLKTIEA